MAAARFDNAEKAFGDVKALEALNLSIDDGEFLVLLGPSGSGKSTALRLLAGLEPLTSGHVWIGDRMADDVPPRDRDVAMVFQDYALYPQMRVRDNMSFGLKMRRVPRHEIARRVEAAAEALELAPLLSRYPRELSGGQRQRVALGRALVREPQVFLMDEPLSNLDAALRVQTRGEVRRLQQELGTTTAYVTHDQVEAMTMGDRVAVLNKGKLQQVGSPAEIYEAPANVFVASFVGSPAMAINPFGLSPNGPASTSVRSGPIELRLNGRALSGSPPSDVLVGTRPEHVKLWGDASDLLGPFSAEVTYVESLGRETFIGLASEGGLTFVAHANGRCQLSIGSTVEFGIAGHAVYLFDADSGDVISAPRAEGHDGRR